MFTHLVFSNDLDSTLDIRLSMQRNPYLAERSLTKNFANLVSLLDVINGFEAFEVFEVHNMCQSLLRVHWRPKLIERHRSETFGGQVIPPCPFGYL